MARKRARPAATEQRTLDLLQKTCQALGDLAEAVTHFCTVTTSYWEGLFHCYQVAGLPRTNNDLEQFFWHGPPCGATRYWAQGRFT